jgi:hypothetical protein
MSVVRLAVGTAVVLLTTALGGCSDDRGDGPDARDLDADVSVPGWPDRADVAILSQDVRGGLPPPEVAPDRFADVPDFVLFGDGVAVWRQGGSFLTVTLTQEGVRTVLGWAKAAGLLDEGGADTGDPEVYDLPDERFDVTTDDGSVTTTLRAPGLDPASLGLSAGEIAARALLSELDDRLRSLPDHLDADRVLGPVTPVRVPGWEVLSRRTTTYPDLAGDEPTWTLDDPRIGCRTITGADQARLESMLAAHETDPAFGRVWAFEDAAWVVFARPLLPGAPGGCVQNLGH